MRTDRWLLGSLVLLVGGVWLLLAWCHGNVGLNFAFPVAGTRLNFEVVSVGAPVMLGIPMIFLGLVLMVIAFITALIAQFHRPEIAENDPITHIRFEE